MMTRSFSLSFNNILENILFLVQCRPPVDFDSCVMEQCNDIPNTSLETSFNVTNQSSHSSRLSNGNVSFLKRRLFEDEEEDDVNLLPEDEESHGPSVGTVTSTQRVRSPPQCDSETEVILINEREM